MPQKKEAAVPKRKRVLIVDDHPMKHGGLSQLIAGDSDLIPCGEAKNTAEALAAISGYRPISFLPTSRSPIATAWN